MNSRINGELTVNVPDCFVPMTDAEMKKYIGSSENRWGVKDEKRKIIISCGWTPKGSFMNYLSDERSVADGVKQRLKRNLNSFRCLGTFSGKHKGHRLKGFDFAFSAESGIYCGKAVVFKHNKHFYGFLYYSLKEIAAEGGRIFDEIFLSLGSV